MPLISLSTVQASSSLAAVRFSRPVHVHSLRIIPSSLAPFSSLPDFSSSTEPEAFPLEVFFNWQTVPSGTEKPRASNVLLHTTLQYSGELLEYEVDPSDKLVTRLLILKGPFTSITLAVYGRDVTEPKIQEESVGVVEVIPGPTYEPVPLPERSLAPLPAILDPSRISDPLALPNRLVSTLSDNVDIVALMRQYLAFPPRSTTETSLDQVLLSYEIGEDWITELIEVLERPLDAVELSEDALQNISERMLESLSQSPSAETISRLISILVLHPASLVTCLLPTLLEFNTGTSIRAALLEASASPYICDCLRSTGLPGDLDPPTFQRFNQNMHAWETLREGNIDLHWISRNLWTPGFLPSVLEILGDSADLSAWPADTRLQVAVAALLTLLVWSEGEGTVGKKTRAILDIWLGEKAVIETIQEALLQPTIQAHLSGEYGRPIMDRVQSAANTSEPSNQINGTANGSAANGHLSSKVSTADLDPAAAYLTRCSKQWPVNGLRQLHLCLQTVLGRVGTDRDLRSITHAFWRQNTSAVQCITLIFLESTRQLSDQNWALDDSTPVRDLLQASHTSIQILRYMVREFGVLSGMLPLIVRALVSLLVSLRQPTYATRYAAEKAVRTDCELLICELTEVENDGEFVHGGADVILPVLLQDAIRWDEGIDPLSRVTAATDLVIAVLDGTKFSRTQSEAWATRLMLELPGIHSLLRGLEGDRTGILIDAIQDIDDDEFGILEWLVLERIACIEEDAAVGARPGSAAASSSPSVIWADLRIESSLQFIGDLGQGRVDGYLEEGHAVAGTFAKALWSIWDRSIPLVASIAERIMTNSNSDARLKPPVAAVLLGAHAASGDGHSLLDLLPRVKLLVTGVESAVVNRPEQLLRALAAALSRLAEMEEEITIEWQRGEAALESSIALLESVLGFFPITAGVVTGIPVPTLSQGTAERFKGLVEVLLGPERSELLISLLSRLSLPLIATRLPERRTNSPLVGSSLRILVQSQTTLPPTTPLSRPLSGLEGGLRTSPPSARKSTPAASLAKTYSNNDFRDLRTLPQARLNTSRPPSRHVDDFELVGDGTAGATPVPVAPTFGVGQLPPVSASTTTGVMPFYNL